MEEEGLIDIESGGGGDEGDGWREMGDDGEVVTEVGGFVVAVGDLNIDMLDAVAVDGAGLGGGIPGVGSPDESMDNPAASFRH